MASLPMVGERLVSINKIIFNYIVRDYNTHV